MNLEPHIDSLGSEILLQLGNGYFAEVEDTRRQCSVAVPVDEGISEVLLASSTT